MQKSIHMPENLSARTKLVLSALASSNGAEFAPVQVQKLFFLLDENISASIGGKQFEFTPYDYGPFDQNVYRELEHLEKLGFVKIENPDMASGLRRYSVSAEGQKAGTKLLKTFPKETQDYMSTISEWICGLSFSQLVGSIYKAYPNMRVNSVFND